MKPSQLQLLPGSLGLEEKPLEKGVWQLLIDQLTTAVGFLGYRILSLGMSPIEDTPSFVAITNSHGIVLLDVISEKITSLEDDEYWQLESEDTIYSRDLLLEYYSDEVISRLKKSPILYDRRTRELNLNIHRVLVFCQNTSEEIEETGLQDVCVSDIITLEDLENNIGEYVKSISSLDLNEDVLDVIFSLLEGTTNYERKKCRIKELETINDFIQKSLSLTFKQDQSQRQISLQLPNGPQRIRGLAGTGKTVVLSLKAALTHFRFPDYKILFLFNTQSLYNQIEKLIEDYYIPEAKTNPDWNDLEVLHAWGGRTRPGLYYNLCCRLGVSPLTFNDVRRSGDGLEAIYSHLLEVLPKKFEPIYDMVLIDEAQDFPQPLFEVVYRITKNPKRIIWAYDEFQSLKDLKIREPDELFGLDADGQPNIAKKDLEGSYEGGIKKDFILPNCYRNPRLTLMVAHGIALGLYSKDGLIDSVDSARDWEALGYELCEPRNSVITEGDRVKVLRSLEHSQNKLEIFLVESGKKLDNLITNKIFDDAQSQIEDVVHEVGRMVNQQGVSPEEIIVVTLDTRTAENTLKTVRVGLNGLGIKAIIPGIVEKSSMFKEKGFVTLTTPFRAKGNEGNVAFVINCQQVVLDKSFRARNSFFVSVTRARGWCRIYGYGSGMEELMEEVESIKEDYPYFNYTRPDDETIRRRRIVLSKSEKEIRETVEAIDKLIDESPEFIVEQLRLKGILE